MRMLAFLVHRDFLPRAVLTACVAGVFFAWELGFLRSIVPSPVRPPATAPEIVFTAILVALLGCSLGLLHWHTKNGSCPIGAKRATRLGGALGAITLICPACLLLPAGLLGAGTILTVLTAFSPLLKLVAVLLLASSTAIMWPRSA